MAASVGAVVRRGFSSSTRRFSSGPIDAGDHGNPKLWRNLSFFVGLPAVGLCMANAWIAHQNEPHERPEFVKYEHLRIITKKFPWGDGVHSLFFNPHTNALPDGYEEDHH